MQTHAGQFDAVLMETLSGIFSGISHRDQINLGHFSITVFDFIPESLTVLFILFN